MAKYQNLRNTINFSEDEEEPIVADDNSAVDDALNSRMRKMLEDTDPVSARLDERLGDLRAMQSQDEALNAGMKRLLGKTPTRAQAAADRALASMSKKQSISDDDLRAAYRPGDRPQMVGEMDLRDPPVKPEPALEMDLRSPREVADQAEAGFGKKSSDIGKHLGVYAYVGDQVDRLERSIRKDKSKEVATPGYSRDPSAAREQREGMATRQGYESMDAGDEAALVEQAQRMPKQEDPEFDAWLASIDRRPTRTEYNVNEDWNTPYPNKTSKPVIEDEPGQLIERDGKRWAAGVPNIIPSADFEALPKEEQQRLSKFYYRVPSNTQNAGAIGGDIYVRYNGDEVDPGYTVDEETGLKIPNRLSTGIKVEDDGTAITPDGRVVSKGEFDKLIAERQAKRTSEASAGKVVPAKADATTSSAPPIPAPLLERLRAARSADAFDKSTGSLGRLLMATGAGFAKNPQSAALMQSYLQQQAKNEGKAFDDEQAFQKAEKAIRDDGEEDSTTSDMAMLGQQVARQLKLMPEENIKRITGKSAKSLISILGLQNKLELEKLKQTGNTERTNLKGGYDITKEAIRSGDRRYAADKRFAASLRAKGVGPRSTGNAEKDQKALAKFDAEVSKFIKSLPAGYGATLDNLDAIGTIIARNDGSPPGVGFWQGAVPNSAAGLVLGEDADQLRTLAENIYNEYIKGNFGSAFSKGEEARFKAAMGAVRAGINSDKFMWGLKEIYDVIEAKVEQGAAGYRDEVVKTAIDRKLHPLPGSKREALRGDAAPPAAQPAPVGDMVTVTNGTRTFRIKASKLAEAEKDGYRRVE